MCDSLHINRTSPLPIYTAALTTEQINTMYCFSLIPKRAILLPLLRTTVAPVPLRGGPTVWQTKADSKNRQWVRAVCLHNDSRVLHHHSTHTDHTEYEPRCVRRQASLSASTSPTKQGQCCWIVQLWTNAVTVASGGFRMTVRAHECSNRAENTTVPQIKKKRDNPPISSSSSSSSSPPLVRVLRIAHQSLHSHCLHSMSKDSSCLSVCVCVYVCVYVCWRRVS